MLRDLCIGTCSLCGGNVMQYLVLHIVGPFPPAVCESCGAEEARGGPVIPMRPMAPPRPMPAQPFIGTPQPWEDGWPYRVTCDHSIAPGVR